MAGKLLLLRVYLDTGSLARGGYYSPLHVSEECATLIPVPETETKSRLDFIDPNKVVDPCTHMPLRRFQPWEQSWLLHNDPRLDLGFYTGYYAPRGRLPRRPGHRLVRNDVLGFIAGLAVYPEGFWDKWKRLQDIRRAFKNAVNSGRAGVYLIGFIVVKAVINIEAVGWNKALEMFPQLSQSPHYLRKYDHPVAVIGEGYIVRPPVRLTEPSQGLARMKPNSFLKRLIGDDAAKALAQSNYRRSRIMRIGRVWKLIDALKEEGHSIERVGLLQQVQD